MQTRPGGRGGAALKTYLMGQGLGQHPPAAWLLPTARGRAGDPQHGETKQHPPPGRPTHRGAGSWARVQERHAGRHRHRQPHPPPGTGRALQSHLPWTRPEASLRLQGRPRSSRRKGLAQPKSLASSGSGQTGQCQPSVPMSPQFPGWGSPLKESASGPDPLHPDPAL